jgi:hypothetical protein
MAIFVQVIQVNLGDAKAIDPEIFKTNAICNIDCFSNGRWKASFVDAGTRNWKRCNDSFLLLLTPPTVTERGVPAVFGRSHKMKKRTRSAVGGSGTNNPRWHLKASRPSAVQKN